MAIAVHAAETIDLAQLAVGTPPIIDVTAHSAHASTTFLYVVLTANTGGDATNVPTSISATWNGVALTQHLSNFSANINRPVAWAGYLRAPATGARTLRFTFDKIGQGFSATIYDMSGVLGSGSPFGAGSDQFRDDTTRAIGTASSLSLTAAAAGQSAIITVMNLAGNGVMSYTAAGFTTVATGEYGAIPGNTGGRSQQTHRYLLNASGTITVSQTCSNAARRHGITLVEILPAATALGASLSESTGIDVALGRQLAAGRGLSEAVGIGVTQAGAIQGTGSPERPAATWAGAAAVYDTAQAKEIKSGRALTVSGVGPTVLSDGRPAGSFPNSSAYLSEKAPANLALSSLTLEGWVEAAARGVIVCVGTPGNGTADIRLRSTNLNGSTANCYLISRTTSSGTQFSTTAADTAALNTPQHLIVVWPANGNPSMYINGELASLTHSGSVSSGAIVIGAADEFRIGDPGVSGLIGMVGKIARINIWPTAWSATRAKVTYRQQADATGNYGLSGENLLADANLSPVAVPFRATATAGRAVTLDPRIYGYDPNGDTMSLSGTPTAPAGHGIAVSAGNIVYTPPPSFTGVGTINYALRDPGGKVSPAIVRVTVSAPIDPPPPVGSVLPTLYQYTGTTRSATPANAQSVINGANNGDIVVLAAGNYGTLTVPANLSIWVRGTTAPFSGLDCTPVFSTADEMTSATDHSPRDRRVTGLQSPSNLARGSIQVANGAANVRISNFYSGNAGGIRFLGSFNRACVHDVWLESIESRGISVRAGTPTDYRGTNPEYVEFRTIIYADSRINGSGASGGGEYTDYGTIIHGTMNVYIEDTVRYGGFNHGISFKGGAGKTKGLLNRNVFASWNQQNAGGNTNQLQLGQNGDQYRNPSTGVETNVGDITCGPITVTACTFIGFNHPSGFRLSAISFQNAASLEVSGSVFGRFFDGGSADGGSIRMVGGDFAGTPTGLMCWRGDLYVHDNDFRTNRTFAPSASGGDRGNCRLRFERNTTPGNGILIVPNGHPVTLGANSGFRTS